MKRILILAILLISFGCSKDKNSNPITYKLEDQVFEKVDIYKVENKDDRINSLSEIKYSIHTLKNTGETVCVRSFFDANIAVMPMSFCQAVKEAYERYNK